jgi:hypothetical protein
MFLIGGLAQPKPRVTQVLVDPVTVKETKPKVELSDSVPLQRGQAIPLECGRRIAGNTDAFVKPIAKITLGIRVSIRG